MTNQYFVTDSSEDTGREIVESQWAILAQLHELILAEQRQRLALQQLVALTPYKYGVKFVDNNIDVCGIINSKWSPARCDGAQKVTPLKVNMCTRRTVQSIGKKRTAINYI